MDLARHRLVRQRLVGPPLASPEAVVEWLGAVQAQDYPGAAWGVGQRATGATAAGVNRALDAGTLIRTHVLRPTWHLVRPADLRWMLARTAPRVKAALASYDRKLELDGPLLARAHGLIARALDGGRHRTRTELADVLDAGGIAARGQRLAHLVMHAELDALVCSGPLRGTRHTYALVDERVPPAPSLDADDALVRLARRYFQSHGPATPHDFSWWAGLPVGDARRALDALGPDAEASEHGGTRYRTVGPAPDAGAPGSTVRLLPECDEHLVAYRDHGPSLHPVAPDGLRMWQTAGTPSHVVRDGLVVGGWKRRVHRHRVEVQATLAAPFTNAERSLLRAEAERYGRFLGVPVDLAVEG